MADTLWTLAMREAGRRSHRLLFPGWDKVLIAVLLFAIYLALVWIFGGKPAATDELILRIAASAAPLVIYPLVYLWYLGRAPNDLFAASQAALKSVEERLKSSLVLDVSPEQCVVPVNTQGILHEVVSGRRTLTSMTFPEMTLRLLCTNTSEGQFVSATSTLVMAKRVDDDGRLSDIGFTEPVELSWARQQGYATGYLGPRSSKFIYVMKRRPRGQLGLYTQLDNYPVEYPLLFQEPGRYRLWITADNLEGAGDSICLDVWSEDERGIGVSIVATDDTPRSLWLASPSEVRLPQSPPDTARETQQ